MNFSIIVRMQVHWKKFHLEKQPPHQVFGNLGSKWPPDEDPGRCRAGTSWHFTLFAKNQYGGQAPGLVTPTFFLWEINQKFFFLAWGFHILATQKNNFCHPGGSQWGPGAFWAHIRAQKGYFWAIFHKNQSFIAFKEFFLTSRTSKHCIYSK